eukprot:619956-Hanusia_phi.AAC.1
MIPSRPWHPVGHGPIMPIPDSVYRQATVIGRVLGSLDSTLEPFQRGAVLRPRAAAGTRGGPGPGGWGQ